MKFKKVLKESDPLESMIKSMNPNDRAKLVQSMNTRAKTETDMAKKKELMNATSKVDKYIKAIDVSDMAAKRLADTQKNLETGPNNANIA